MNNSPTNVVTFLKEIIWKMPTQKYVHRQLNIISFPTKVCTRCSKVYT